MKKVGIAGIGGIGSNIAVHLVRSGYLSFMITDFDRVEYSNLNRQFYFGNQIGMLKIDALEENLKRINDKVNIEKVNILLDETNIINAFRECDIIVEGFDLAKNKVKLIELFGDTDKIIISACGVAGLNIDSIGIKNIGKNIRIVGDFVTDFKDKKLFSPKVFIVSSIMANIILRELGFNDII